jgi:glucose-1-phosphate thymidylyltransferase
MKGIILAGGMGTRLLPLTRVTNKHLLPIYDKPMVYYPLETLIKCGIKNILIVSGPEHSGHFLRLLGSGKEFGVKLTYEIQEEAGGIAQALSLAEDFADGGSIAVILGDNIYDGNFEREITAFKEGAKLFLKEVEDPKRFGVAELQDDKIIGIEEKPESPKSKQAVTGLYVYENSVFDYIKQLKPSGRGELEITDVNNFYVKEGKCSFHKIEGFWSDAGTMDSLFNAALFMRNKEFL